MTENRSPSDTKSKAKLLFKRVFLSAFLSSILIIAGCKTVPESDPEPVIELPTVPVNPAIEEAEQQLIQAQQANAEWLIIETTLSSQPMALSEILQKAQQMQEDGNISEATRLAEKVARFALLGLNQANSQQGSLPHYSP